MIRPETESDSRAIRDVTIEAFRNAPHAAHTEHLIIEALRESDALTVSLVADEDSRVVGHIAVSPITISDGTGGWHGLGPVSVAPEHQRQGIGSALVRSAIARLRQANSAGCVLLGDPRFYSRFGFRTSSALVLPEVPAEYFQIIYFDTSRPSGTVTYHPAFDLAKVPEK